MEHVLVDFAFSFHIHLVLISVYVLLVVNKLKFKVHKNIGKTVWSQSPFSIECQK